jgi:hypothetical protein
LYWSVDRWLKILPVHKVWWILLVDGEKGMLIVTQSCGMG